LNTTLKFAHDDIVNSDHRFTPLVYRGQNWDFRHLDAFAMNLDPGLGFNIDVVVLFSCHCFTHLLRDDVRSPEDIPDNEIFYEGRNPRVLSEERYNLSKSILRPLIEDLPNRRLLVENSRQFFVVELSDSENPEHPYIVFVTIRKDDRRKKRILLRVQSAYRLDKPLTRRQQNAGSYTLQKVLRDTYKSGA
jgi:hypothetical protein